MHPFQFAQNISQVYIQLTAGDKEETIRFHSIYSCSAVLLTTRRMIFSKALLSICSPTVSEAKHRKDNIDFPERSAARHNLLGEERPRCSLALGQQVISLSDCKVNLCSTQGERGAGTDCLGGNASLEQEPRTPTCFISEGAKEQGQRLLFSLAFYLRYGKSSSCPVHGMLNLTCCSKVHSVMQKRGELLLFPFSNSHCGHRRLLLLPRGCHHHQVPDGTSCVRLPLPEKQHHLLLIAREEKPVHVFHRTTKQHWPGPPSPESTQNVTPVLATHIEFTSKHGLKILTKH